MPSLAGVSEIAWRLNEAGMSDPRAFAYSPEVQYCSPDLARIVPEENGHISPQILEAYVEYARPNLAPPPPNTLLSVNKRSEQPYPHLGDERILMVGAGAGTIICASYLVHRGVDPSNITIADPSGKFGGIWQEDWVRSGGFNNPGPPTFSRRHRLSLRNRDGNRMLQFLGGIAEDYLPDAQLVRSKVADLRRNKHETAWLAVSDEGGITESEHVVLATGSPRARKINSSRMSSNLDHAHKFDPSEITVERHQRQLTPEELSSGRPIILMGLGNSVAYMLRQIHAHEDRNGRDVNYWVVTDKSRSAVRRPGLPHGADDPIFRNPDAGDLTGYSADIKLDRSSYFRALNNGKILKDVREVRYDPKNRVLAITDKYDSTRYAQGARVFALLGYDVDKSLLRTAGALSRGPLRREKPLPNIRPSDGAVETREHGYASGLFAVGALAAIRNPNAAVVAGIFAQVPATALTIALRSYARQAQTGSRQLVSGRI